MLLKKQIEANTSNNIIQMLNIAVLSLIICFTFSGAISDFVYDRLVEYCDVKIENLYVINENSSETPKILDNYVNDNYQKYSYYLFRSKKYGYYSFENIVGSIIDSNGISISEDGSYIQLNNEDSYVTLHLPVCPNTCLTVSINDNKYALGISNENNTYNRVIAAENALDINNLEIYLYNTYNFTKLYFKYFLVYVLCYALIFMLLYITKTVFNLLFKGSVTAQYKQRLAFVIICSIYVLYTSLTYYFNWNLFQVGDGADAYYYMHPIIGDEHGKISINVIATNLYSFRGYFSIVVAIISKAFAKIFRIEPIYFFYMICGIIVAYTIAYALPKLYKGFFEEDELNYLMTFSFFGIFLLFWGQIALYTLMDIPAAMFALCGCAHIIYTINDQKKIVKNAVMSGIFWGIAISFRTTYKYVFFGLLVYIIIKFFVEISRKEIRLKEALLKLAAILVGLLIVTIPQFMINYERGHIGFFPYDSGWKYDYNSASTTTLMWDSFTTGIHQYGLMPSTLVDQQLALVDQQLYGNKVYNLNDLIFILFNNPLEFICAYFKRLFWALSFGVESVYATVKIPESIFTMVSLLNYFIWWNYGKIIIGKKEGTILRLKHYIVIMLLTIATVLIQNMTHIERRYHLFYFLFVDFIVCYSCFRKENKNVQKRNVASVICAFIFVMACYTVKQAIYYNFTM